MLIHWWCAFVFQIVLLFVHCGGVLEINNDITSVEMSEPAVEDELLSNFPSELIVTLSKTQSKLSSLSFLQKHQQSLEHHELQQIQLQGRLPVVAGMMYAILNGSEGLLDRPSAIWSDSSGIIYVCSDINGRVYSIEPTTYVVTLFAGGGTSTNDNIPATSMNFSGLTGITGDNAGTIFLTDSYFIYKVNSSSGYVSYFVGGPTQSSTADGTTLTSSTTPLGNAYSLAYDSYNGVIYYSSLIDCRIRYFSLASMIIQTLAGNGVCAESSNALLATATSLHGLRHLYLNSVGDIYLTEYDGARISKVDQVSGFLYHMFGTGSTGNGAVSNSTHLVLGINSEIAYPQSITGDTLGNIYVGFDQNFFVNAYDVTGYVYRYAGNGVSGVGPDATAATSASIGIPTSIWIDSSGVLVIGSSGTNALQWVDYYGPTIEPTEMPTMMPYPEAGYPSGSSIYPPPTVSPTTPDQLPVMSNTEVTFPIPSNIIRTIISSTSGILYEPTTVWVDSNGLIYINSYSSLIYTINTTSHVVSHLAGGGEATVDEMPALWMNFNEINGIAGDGTEMVYFTDILKINKINVTSGIGYFVTAADTNVTTAVPDGTVVSSATAFGYIRNLAIDSSSTLYFISSEFCTVRYFGLSDMTVYTIAGNGACHGGYGIAMNSFLPLSMSLGNPMGLYVDDIGNIYFAEASAYYVSKIDRQNNTLEHILGIGYGGYLSQGQLASSSYIGSPISVAGDVNGNIYVGFSSEAYIAVVTSAGYVFYYAGTGYSGSGPDGVEPLSAQVGLAYGLWMDTNSQLFITSSDTADLQVVGYYDVTSQPAWQPTMAPTYPRSNLELTFPIQSGIMRTIIESASSGETNVQVVSSPDVIWVSPEGVIYYPTMGYVYSINPETFETKLFAGGGEFSTDNIPATSFWLSNLVSLAGDSNGTLYVAEAGRIHRVSIASGILSFWVGDAYSQESEPVDGSILTQTSNMNSITNIALDSSGNLYYISSNTCMIRYFSIFDLIVWTVAGNGQCSNSIDGAQALSSPLYYPSYFWISSIGEIYLSETYSNTIVKINQTTGSLSHFVTSQSTGFEDGFYFNYPTCITGDEYGNLYVANQYQNRIWTFLDNGLKFIYAGSGEYQTGPDNVFAREGGLKDVYSLYLDTSDQLYIGTSYAIQVVGYYQLTSAPTMAPTVAPEWWQVGSTLDGQVENEYFGSSVAISKDGYTLAIGTPYSQVVGNVRVYQYDSLLGNWVQKGQTIERSDGVVSDGNYGYVTLNEDGSILAIGCPFCSPINASYSGEVIVYFYNTSSLLWEILGQPMNTFTSGSLAGKAITLSDTGYSIAVGCYNTSAGIGMVNISYYDNSRNSWVDEYIFEPSSYGTKAFGFSVAMSGDGLFLLVGAPLSSVTYSNSGSAFAYYFQQQVIEGIPQWYQFELNLNGESADEWFGYSVGISKNASVAIIGSPFADNVNISRGFVKIYYSNGYYWEPTTTIQGNGIGDRFGYSVAMTEDGEHVAIGALTPGYVKIYSFNGNNWVQSGRTLYGTNAGTTWAGYDVAVSLPLKRVAFGAPIDIPSSIINAGAVYVYDLSSGPTIAPTTFPSGQPSSRPSNQPSSNPSDQPTSIPSGEPTSQPTNVPSMNPTLFPSSLPSSTPSIAPSMFPSTQPTTQPSSLPSAQPSSLPTIQPTQIPSSQPSIQPTSEPSGSPTLQPTMEPTSQPTSFPSDQPSAIPTSTPSVQPTYSPSSRPSSQPSGSPLSRPSSQPSQQPSGAPSNQPSTMPTGIPTSQPSTLPTAQPSSTPTTTMPTSFPSAQPFSQPSGVPSAQPSMQPTGLPTTQPSESPSSEPSSQPTVLPLSAPTSIPSGTSSSCPTNQPSSQPTANPSFSPSTQPTVSPSSEPSSQPTVLPLSAPTSIPSGTSSSCPTNQPSSQPTANPSFSSSGEPSRLPSVMTHHLPSSHPSRVAANPTWKPSVTESPSVNAINENITFPIESNTVRTIVSGAQSSIVGNPSAMWIDSSTGILYITSESTNTIIAYDPTALTLSTIVGGGYLQENNVLATRYQLIGVNGITGDASGNLYVVDGYFISKINLANGTLTWIAGHISGNTGEVLVNMQRLSTSTSLLSPFGLHLDSSGYIYFAETVYCQIWRFSTSDMLLQLVAGNGDCVRSSSGSLATSSSIGNPRYFFVNTKGDLFLTETYQNIVSVVNGTTGIISILFDNSESVPTRKLSLIEEQQYYGTSTSNFYYPYAIAGDSYGNVFVSFVSGYQIIQIAPDGYQTVYAGNGEYGVGEDNVSPLETSFGSIRGLFMDEYDQLYVASSTNSVQVIGYYYATNSPTAAPSFAPVYEWSKVGSAITGIRGYEYFGSSMALSRDGLTVAAGSSFSVSTPAVKVYSLNVTNNKTWEQIGQTIYGFYGGSFELGQLALNENGTILAIGFFKSSTTAISYVKVFEYNQITDSWDQLGQSIEAPNSFEMLGRSLILSDTGHRLVFGISNTTDEYGKVNTYNFDTEVNAWVLLTSSLSTYNTITDGYGISLAMNPNGTFLAVGAPFCTSSAYYYMAGCVYTYTLNEVESMWIEQVSSIKGYMEYEWLGMSVAADISGTTLAVGAPYKSNSLYTGSVYIYKRYSYNYGTSTQTYWSVVTELMGIYVGDQFGWSVGMDEAGTTVAAGALAGYIQLYEYKASGYWSQKGSTLSSSSGSAWVIFHVSLSNTGVVAFSSPNDTIHGVLPKAGIVFVYTQSSTIISSPTVMPTTVPTQLPSRELTYYPSISPSKSPTVSPSPGAPMVMPTIVPTQSPSRRPTYYPSISPSKSPTVSPSQGAPTVGPTTVIEAPLILTIVYNVTSTSIKLYLTLDDNCKYAGDVYCQAYFESAPNSTASMKLTGTKMSYASNQHNVVVSLPGLTPLTSYKTYCYVETVLGPSNSYAQVLRTQKSIVTSCCRSLTFSSYPVFLYSSSSKNTGVTVYSYQLSALPSNSVSVVPSIYFSNGTSVSSSLISASPKLVTFNVTSLTFQGSFALVFSLTSFSSDVRVSLKLSGPSAQEFNVSSVRTQVLGSVDYPPAPALSSAIFGDSGTDFYVTMDSQSDLGGQMFLSFWSCNNLLEFNGSTYTNCTWLNYTTISGTFTSNFSSYVSIGEPIYLRPNIIRARCVDADTSVCSSYNTSLTQAVVLKTALNPTSPTVVLVVPTTVGTCDNVTVDSVQSIGNGGRDWKSLTWTVFYNSGSDQSTATTIQTFLQRYGVQSTSELIVVPRNYFTIGSYSISLTVENFFGMTGTATKVITVSAAAYNPLVAIVSTSDVSLTSRQVYSAYAKVSYSSCTVVSSTLRTLYSWYVTRGGSTVSSLVSVSKTATKFSLSSYSLSTGNAYQVVLNVSIVSNNRVIGFSTDKQTVSVYSGSVHAVVKGGATRTVSQNQNLTLDASSSYDDDTASPSFTYVWSCAISSPVVMFGMDCSSIFSRTASSPARTLVGSRMNSNATYVVTVIVSSGTRTSSSAVTVKVVGLGSPSVSLVVSSASLSSVSSATSTYYRVQQYSNFTVAGTIITTQSVSTQWGVYIDGTNETVKTYSTVSKVFPSRYFTNGLPIYLTLPASSFAAGSMITFRLTCSIVGSTVSGTSSVDVLIHAVPRYGSVTISPTSGVALSTQFTILTTSWAANDVSAYPLQYSFAYSSRPASASTSSAITTTGTSMLSLQPFSTLSSITTLLPAGLSSYSFTLNIFVIARDAYSASSTSPATATVVVKLAATSTGTTQVKVDSSIATFLTSNLNSSLNAGQVGSAIQVLNNIASTVNSIANCTGYSETVCSSLYNRNPCSKQGGTCGSCLSGYVGLSGDSNTPCVSSYSSVATSGQIGAACLIDSDCLFQNCTNQVCVAPYKQCPTSFPNLVCSGLGSCKYFDVRDRELSVCDISNVHCRAVCLCDNGYGGSDCSLNSTDISTLSSVRKGLCDGIVSLYSSHMDASSSTVATLVSTLSESFAASEITDESTYDSCQTALSILMQLVQDGYAVDDNDDVSSETLQTLVSTISNFFDANTTSYSANGTVSSTTLSLNSVLNQVSAGLLQFTANGQTAVSFTSSNLRLSAQKEFVLDILGSTFVAPSTDEDLQFNVLSSSLEFDANVDFTSCDSGEGYMHLVTSGIDRVPNMYSDVYNTSVDLESTFFGIETTRTSNDSLIVSNSTNSTTDSPAFYITIQFLTGATLPNYNLTVDEILQSGRNYTFPICQEYDSETGTFSSCIGCEPYTYTTNNITFACYDVSQICGGQGGTTRRRLGSNAWKRYLNFLSSDHRNLASDDATDDYMSSDSIITSRQYAAIFSALAEAFVSNISTNPFAVNLEEAVPMMVFVGLLVMVIFLGAVYLRKLDTLEQEKFQREVVWPPRVSHKVVVQTLLNSVQGVVAAFKKKKTKIEIEMAIEDIPESMETQNIHKMNVFDGEHIIIRDSIDVRSNHSINSADLGSFYKDSDIIDKSNFPHEDLGEIPMDTGSVFTKENENLQISDSENSQLENNDQYKDDTLEVVQLMDIVDNIVPSVFRSSSKTSDGDTNANTSISFISFFLALWYNHSYLTHFTRISFTMSHLYRWLVFCKSLMLTLLIDTLFFEIFYTNDGTCELFTSKTDCLQENNAVTGQTKCKWSNDQCSLQGPPESFVFMIMLALLTMTITIPLDVVTSIPLDMYCLKRPDWTRSIFAMFQLTKEEEEDLVAAADMHRRFEAFLLENSIKNSRSILSWKKALKQTPVTIQPMPYSMAAELDLLRYSIMQHFQIMHSMQNEQEHGGAQRYQVLYDLLQARTSAIKHHLHISLSGRLQSLSVWEQLSNIWWMKTYPDINTRTVNFRLLQLVQRLRQAKNRETQLKETYNTFRVTDESFVERIVTSVNDDEKHEISASTMWDHILISSFVMEHLTPVQRYLIVSKLGCFEEFLFPEKTHYLNWCLAWFWLWGQILFCFYWMILWSVNDGRALLLRWGINFMIGTVQDIFLVNILKLFILYLLARIIVLPDLVAMRQWLKHMLVLHRTNKAAEEVQSSLEILKQEEVISDSPATVNHSSVNSRQCQPTAEFAVVQHLSPTCRLARRLYCENKKRATTIFGSEKLSFDAAMSSVFTRIFAEFDDFDAHQCNHWYHAQHKLTNWWFYSRNVWAWIIIAVLVVLLVDEQIADIVLDTVFMGISSAFLLLNNAIATVPANVEIPVSGTYYLVGIYVIVFVFLVVWWVLTKRNQQQSPYSRSLSRQKTESFVIFPSSRSPSQHISDGMVLELNNTNQWPWGIWFVAPVRQTTSSGAEGERRWAMQNQPSCLQPNNNISDVSLDSTDNGVKWVVMFTGKAMSEVAKDIDELSVSDGSQKQNITEDPNLRQIQQRLNLLPKEIMLNTWVKHHQVDISNTNSVTGATKFRHSRRMQKFHHRERIATSLSTSLRQLARILHFMYLTNVEELHTEDEVDEKESEENKCDGLEEVTKSFSNTSRSDVNDVTEKEAERHSLNPPPGDQALVRFKSVPFHYRHFGLTDREFLQALESGNDAISSKLWVSVSLGAMVINHMLPWRCRPECRMLSTDEIHELLVNMIEWMKITNEKNQNIGKVCYPPSTGLGVTLAQFRVWFAAAYLWYSQSRKLQRQRKRNKEVDIEFLPLLLSTTNASYDSKRPISFF